MIQSSSSHGEYEGIVRLLAILRERRKAILICMAASFLVAAVGYLRSPTRYTSEAILALDVRKLQALPTESVVSPLPQESPVLRTELDIIGSQSMAERVAEALRKPDPKSGPQDKYSRVYDDPRTEADETPTSRMVEDLMKNVRVVNDGRSYTIYISYSAGDPVHAARVANAFGEAYIDYQIDLQTTATRRVSDWLGERLVSLRTKLEESERQATEFREKTGLIDTGGIPLLSQRLSSLNTELTALQTRLAGAKARLATALDVQAGGDGIGIAEVLASPTVQTLRAEQARVVRVIGEIDESGALMNPQRPQLVSQLASLKTQISQEIAQVIASLRSEIEASEKQQSEVERNFNAVHQAISEASIDAVQSGQLDREAAANRSIYETYLARYKQTIEQDGIATAEARIISRAMPSHKPTTPNQNLWALLGLLMGCGSGIAAALILHLTDTSVGSIPALQQKTGLALIGKIPRMPVAELHKGAGMFSSNAADFYSAFADLQTYIQLEPDKSRVIAFTSSTDREGKTFVIANLARSLALSGQRVLIIDANLRNPALGMEFDLQHSRHLARAVSQEISLDEVIQHDRASSVDVIVARADDTPPNLVLGNRRFAALLSEVRQNYEIVLIDAPSVSYDLDLLRIASLSDTTILVVRQDIANSASLQTAVMKLRSAGQHVAGMVLNGVRRQKKHSAPSNWLDIFKLPKRQRSGARPDHRPSVVVQNVR
jgi:capsular exopolysaccharide synthesis family protein